MLESVKQLFPRFYGQYLLFKLHRYGYYRKIHRRRLKEVREKGSARVLFVLCNLSMWRYEDVCRLLMGDPRFDVRLIICPLDDLTPLQKTENTSQLVAYCERQHWPYIVKADYPQNIIDSFNPDIIFFPQMYKRLFGNELDCEKNMDRLLAYSPYGLITVAGDFVYNSQFINNSWKVFIATSLHQKFARKHSFINGKNTEVVGDSHAKAFLQFSGEDPWKKQEHGKKRVIWAPHFSINPGYLNRGSFLWIHQLMKDLALRYRDDIQFVFKPHPWLLTELYKHPDWGEKKANAYYDFWKNGENTQLETGTYVNLFCTSDALIHDCGSFSAEYHYTGKPVCFVSNDFEGVYQGLDTFGTLCMDLHYRAQNEEDILAFFQDVVLGGNDPRRPERESFRNRYLIPEAGSSFEDKIYRSMVRDLFGD